MLFKYRTKYSFGVLNDGNTYFFGSGNVAFPSLLVLHKAFLNKLPNLKVISHYSISTNNNNKIEMYCKQNGISFCSPITQRHIKKAELWKKFIEQMQEPTFGIVCSFGYLLPQNLINKFTNGLIVVHPSLLPKYRGGSPIFHAMANGQKQSGVSYIQISKHKYDEGNILFQKKCSLDDKSSYQQVEDQLAKLSSQSLLQVIENIDKLRPGQKQDSIVVEEHLKKAPIIKYKTLDISKNAEQVYNWSRALQTPKVIFKANDKEVIVHLVKQYMEDNDNCPVGTLRRHQKKMFFKCKDMFIRMDQWHHPTSRIQPIHTFYRRYKQYENSPDFAFI